MHLYKTVPQYIAVFLLICFTSFLALNWATPIYSQTVDELEDEINEKTEELNKQKTYLSSIEARIKEISGSNYSLSQKISMINDEITKLKKEIESRDIEIDDKLSKIDEKQKLLDTKKDFLDEISAELYMKSRYSGEQLIFSFSTLDKMLQNLFVKKNAISILREDIEKINGEYSNLLEVKVALEKEKAELDAQKKDLDDSYKLLAAEKNKIQAELNAQIATKNTVTRKINGLSTELSDLQYNLIIARQGGTYVNADSVPTSGDYNATLAGFEAKAPAGSFGVFSIGAYTNRVGLSQWGAKARGEAGQSYAQILTAYYPGFALKRQSVPQKIKVKFCDKINNRTYCDRCVNERIIEYSFEDFYMRGIYEISESWPYETIKAQVVAARTYALRVTNNGATSIRADECGQVFKTTLKTGDWARAVVETQGGDKNNPYVLKNSSGSYATGMFSAVHGGWVRISTSGSGWWDTYDLSGSKDWLNSWDNKSKVSWFYKSWYGDTSYEGNGTCGRYPWLSNTEMADILNIYQIWKSKQPYKDTRILPIFDACHSDGNPYSYEEARNLATLKVRKVYSVVVYNSNGFTNKIEFQTDAGPITISGWDFKTVYNVRAPGHLHIPQNSTFVHINIHKK